MKQESIATELKDKGFNPDEINDMLAKSNKATEVRVALKTFIDYHIKVDMTGVDNRQEYWTKIINRVDEILVQGQEADKVLAGAILPKNEDVHEA